MRSKFLAGFVYAFQGIKVFIKERNARVHLVATVLVVGMAYWLNVSLLEWTILILCIGLVLGAEAFNSSIERLVDLVSPEKNEKAGTIKDVAAGAVLIVAICAALVGLIIFGPKLLELL